VKSREAVFVDTGAWIALALTRDPLHARAREAWDSLLAHGARLSTSVPVVLETFTFLDRHATRDVALAWKDTLGALKGLRVEPCSLATMQEAWLRADDPPRRQVRLCVRPPFRDRGVSPRRLVSALSGSVRSAFCLLPSALSLPEITAGCSG